MLGQHLELRWYRSEFLRAQGMGISPENQRRSIAAICDGKFDVVVLSYSLTHKTGQELLETRRPEMPECPVIIMTEKRWEYRHLNPAETVLVSDGPQGWWMF